MDVFAITPASPKPTWLLMAVCVLLAGMLVMMVYVAYSSRHARVEMSSDRIKLVGDLWGRELPLDVLDVSKTRVLDITRDSEYALHRRTLGTGLPGYASGWFKLENGEKALAYVTDRRRVVYVPTAKGYSLLLSVDDPEAFIETLQRRRR